MEQALCITVAILGEHPKRVSAGGPKGTASAAHIPQLKLLPLVSVVLFRLYSWLLLQGKHKSVAFYLVGQGCRSALLFLNICSVLNAGWVLYKGAFRAAVTGQAGR